MAPAIFKYKPIDLASDAIRLVRIFKGYVDESICCELFETWLHEVEGVPYEALSYAWGDTRKSAEIVVSGCTAKVTKNLFTALQHLRLERRDRVMWIDAICIDQDNSKEQSHQVGQMRTIYSKAEEVIIWLGLGSSDIDLLMDSMNLVHSNALATTQNWTESSECWQVAWPIARHRLGGIHHTEIDARVGDTLQELLERPWFRRVWVIQEVASARAASIMCGSRTISTRTFAQIPPLLDIKPDAHIQAVLDVMPGYLRKSTWWSHSQDLWTLLEKFQHSEAGDPRDKVYALLGISSDACKNQVFRPNYDRTPEQVVQDTTLFFLFGSPTIPTNNLFTADHPLPSWPIPDVLLMKDELPYNVLRWAINANLPMALILLEGNRIDVNRRFFVPKRTREPTGSRERETLLSYLVNTEIEPDDRITRAVLAHPVVDVNLDHPLAGAAICGHLTAVELLLKHKDIDVNLNNLLAEVASLGHDSIVRLLLKHEQVDVNLGSPLKNAASNGHKDTVKLLLGHDNINVNGNSLSSRHEPLLSAIIHGHTEVVELLLGHDDIDLNLGLPLSKAAEMRHYPIVKLLLARSDVFFLARDNAHTNALRDCMAIAMVSLSRGDVDAMISALFKDPQNLDSNRSINMLHNVDADVDNQDVTGRTPLSRVAESARDVTVSVLLKDANVQSQDNNGRTLLSWAVSVRNTENNGVILFMLRRDADIESRCDDGRTPLSWTAQAGSYDNTRLLLQNGADIESRDNDGRTPLSWAAGEGRYQIVQLLIQKGADVQSRDNSGRTCLSWARLGNYYGMKAHILVDELLVKAGGFSKYEDREITAVIHVTGSSDGRY
ncbi:ankyrin repeat-containing domain protein [Ilyonectria sp. MPI-CAGE-AT-0026]|nr:ankyrin repeat-containing domain protein [Ilyonectria sp. MPI-CAGE-AT-0026]